MDFSFPAVIALLLLTGGKTDELPLMLLCCVLHECGHLMMMLLLRRRPEAITLYGGGIRITPQVGRMGSQSGDIAVLLAGCAVNFLLAAAGYLACSMSPFTQTNLLLGVFNLLPFSYFDGGRVLNILTGGRGMTALRAVFMILGGAYIIMTAVNGRMSISFLVTFMFIVAEEFLSGRNDK